jgi:hypothetical protein
MITPLAITNGDLIRILVVLLIVAVAVWLILVFLGRRP